MASISSSPTSVPTRYEYDVFLCFRSLDTRYYVTDKLYMALCRAGIRTFRDDDDETRKVQELKPEIERSIRTSRASVVVLSKNFANSCRCLDVLCLILEQKRKCNHFVLPVFCEVDPSNVLKQQESFTIELKQDTKWTADNVKRWKEALIEVADLKGILSSEYETIFTAKIVEKIYSQLGHVEPQSLLPGLIGMETRADGITSWLNNKELDSPSLAIWGVGGSGKTTLAKHAYYSNQHNFQGCSFLEDIENHPDGLLGVQRQLLRDISGDDDMMTSNVYEGALQLEKIIRTNKVLIVIDGIVDKDTLSKLFGTTVSPTQSKIIITTRLLHTILTCYQPLFLGCHVYEVQLLNDSESLELLCFQAFGSRFPMEGFEEVALQLAQYCQRNPLALKVLGSSLSGLRARKDLINWRSKIDSLNSLKGYPGNNIQRVLNNSFDSLPSDVSKELFLHIACLFVGERVYDVETILEDDYDAKSGIVTLINRCFLTHPRDSGGKLAMHGLLQEMARAIVSNGSQDYVNRSRVWRNDESYRLLRNGYGSDKIEGLLVDMRAAEQWMKSEAFKTSSLVKMKNLKLLQLNYVELTGSYENFPNLRWLRWHGCFLKTIPPGLLTSCLVALYMNFGVLEEFDPYMVFNSLKILDLQSSPKLARICNLHRLPKLETLIIDNCTSLTHVCLKGCTKLWKASPNLLFVNQQEKHKAMLESRINSQDIIQEQLTRTRTICNI